MYDDGLSLFNQKKFDEAIENFLQDTEHKDRFLQIANCYCRFLVHVGLEVFTIKLF